MATKYTSITTIAERYGYSYQAVKKWINAEGMPFDETKRKIPEDEATKWIIENKIKPLREVSLNEEMQREKLREQKAKADIAQMAAAKEAGALIETDYVQAALDGYLNNFKDVIRGIPRNYVVEILESATDIKSLKDKLNTIINEALTEIGELLIDESVLEEVEEPDIEIGETPTTEGDE